MGKNCPRSCKNYFPRATTTYSRVTSHGVMLTSKVMADNETSSVISDSFSLESHEIDDDSFEEGEPDEETNKEAGGQYQGAIRPYMFEPVSNNACTSSTTDLNKDSSSDEDNGGNTSGARLQQDVTEWQVKFYFAF